MDSPKTQFEDPLNHTIQTMKSAIVCFSHLRWNFVYQRPQHLLTRFVRDHRIFYVEEPIVEDSPTRMELKSDPSGVLICVPYLNRDLNLEELRREHIRLIDQLIEEKEIASYLLWYYTPMAVPYTEHLKPLAIVYDCMDELSHFKNASPKMKVYEAELLKKADLVFTGGISLYEVKKEQHSNVHAFPSSIDLDHFTKARTIKDEPADQAGLPHPRIGYFGVIDERMDFHLLGELANAHPEWHFVMVGPIAKINPLDLPRSFNIHYLGIKQYADLPSYLSGWDVAILPFAINDSTRFISPTKTPEYLAGGKPVVSTSIKDVIKEYGEQNLVHIADGVVEFGKAIEQALVTGKDDTGRLRKLDKFLSQNSWDQTWTRMSKLIDNVVEKRIERYGMDVSTPLYERQLNQHTEGNGKHLERKVFDYLIVGAGFAGSILAERLASGSGKKVLLIERRSHIAGNAYDHYDDDGLLVHKYGPHIFHTNSQEVFAYLSQFTKWRPYEHRVRASVDGQLVPMPINLDTINILYGLHLNSFEMEKFLESLAESRESIRTSEDVVVSKVGRNLYEKFFRNYTRKQWDLDPSELDATVTARVPIRLNRDDRYFTDIYQAMPANGYTRMFENILDHPNISIMLNTDYQDIVNYISYRELIYTGPVDEYFGYRFGKLPYRSLEFKFETHEQQVYQPIPVINYPNEHLYTRVTEFKYLTGQMHPKTSIVYEYPCSRGDPYYPIPRPENAVLYQKYQKLAQSISGVHFAGRLATYRYYNMDQVAAQALTLYSKLMGIQRTQAPLTQTSSRFMIDMPCPLLISMTED